MCHVSLSQAVTVTEAYLTPCKSGLVMVYRTHTVRLSIILVSPTRLKQMSW